MDKAGILVDIFFWVFELGTGLFEQLDRNIFEIYDETVSEYFPYFIEWGNAVSDVIWKFITQDVNAVGPHIPSNAYPLFQLSEYIDVSVWDFALGSVLGLVITFVLIKILWGLIEPIVDLITKVIDAFT